MLCLSFIRYIFLFCVTIKVFKHTNKRKTVSDWPFIGTSTQFNSRLASLSLSLPLWFCLLLFIEILIICFFCTSISNNGFSFSSFLSFRSPCINITFAWVKMKLYMNTTTKKRRKIYILGQCVPDYYRISIFSHFVESKVLSNIFITVDAIE